MVVLRLTEASLARVAGKPSASITDLRGGGATQSEMQAGGGGGQPPTAAHLLPKRPPPRRGCRQAGTPVRVLAITLGERCLLSAAR
jgi:hypothetical protein